MGRPGNAGSFTAADHIAVLKGGIHPDPRPVADRRAGQHRRPAGASHDVIDHLTSLNTAPEHGNRGRRVEYTIGWPVDEPTVAGIERLRESDWGAAVHADGALDPAAQVADLTGIMRHGPDADRLATRPRCMRLIARRTPRPATKPAKLGEHPDWEYGAFAHLHPRRAGAVPRRPSPHPGPRRRPDDPVQGLRRPQPALDRLRPATPPGCRWPPWPPR